MFLLQAFFFYHLAYQGFALLSNKFADLAFSDANYQQKLEWVMRFGNATIYPNNAAEAAKINSTLFSEDIQGRIDLSGNFDGRELNTEVPSFLHNSSLSLNISPLSFQLITCSMYSEYLRPLLRNQIPKSSTFGVFRLIIL